MSSDLYERNNKALSLNGFPHVGHLYPQLQSRAIEYANRSELPFRVAYIFGVISSAHQELFLGPSYANPKLEDRLVEGVLMQYKSELEGLEDQATYTLVSMLRHYCIEHLPITEQQEQVEQKLYSLIGAFLKRKQELKPKLSVDFMVYKPELEELEEMLLKA